MSGDFDAFFLESEPGQRFCVFHRPRRGQAVKGAIVHVHPLAEELNRSRRMAALQSRAFAAAGYAVLQIDLYGCGDSSGDFGEASWHAWAEDVVMACAWLRSRIDAPLWLWGVRAGCLIAAEAAGRVNDLVGFILWQPMFSGRLCLQQFLRLKIAGDLLSGENGAAMVRLREQLAAGEPLEIAGYLLTPRLANALERAELSLSASMSDVLCIEVSGRTAPVLSPAAMARINEWKSAGNSVRAMAVAAPPLWQTAEIVECPALLEATLSMMEGGGQ